MSIELRPLISFRSLRLEQRLGVKLIIATESLQHTGSFKFRAAKHVVGQVAQRRLITASSGNFGQALALACKLAGKSCTIVMPANSAAVKVAAVREYGGHVDLIDPKIISRQQRVQQLSRADPDAYIASAYDDPLVIEGNATLGTELANVAEPIDFVIAPIGGGGLMSGIIIGLQQAGRPLPCIGAEPLMANDAARSLRAGQLLRNLSEPQTIADGARTLSLGNYNWPILQRGLDRIIEVPENLIAEAMRLLFVLANLKAEPTGALALAAILSDLQYFRGKSICCVVSGGNVDTELFTNLVAA